MRLSWSPIDAALIVSGSRRSAIESWWRLVPEEDRTPAQRRLVIALIDYVREYHERTGQLAPGVDGRREVIEHVATGDVL